MKEITFKDIQYANNNIETTDIRGNSYAEVNQRIKAFRMIYPTGAIKTKIVSNNDGVCVIQAEAGYYDENGYLRILGTGYAYEKENSTFINKTSYIENCETSAVGRALGMCGFGIDTSVASYEEVATAIANQDKPVEKPKAEPKKKAEKKIEVVDNDYSNFDIKGVEDELIDTAMVNYLTNEIPKHDITVDFICNTYKVKSLKDMKNKFFMHIINNWEELKKRYDKA